MNLRTKYQKDGGCGVILTAILRTYPRNWAMSILYTDASFSPEVFW